MTQYSSPTKTIFRSDSRTERDLTVSKGKQGVKIVV